MVIVLRVYSCHFSSSVPFPFFVCPSFYFYFIFWLKKDCDVQFRFSFIWSSSDLFVFSSIYIGFLVLCLFYVFLYFRAKLQCWILVFLLDIVKVCLHFFIHILFFLVFYLAMLPFVFRFILIIFLYQVAFFASVFSFAFFLPPLSLVLNDSYHFFPFCFFHLIFTISSSRFLFSAPLFLSLLTLFMIHLLSLYDVAFIFSF